MSPARKSTGGRAPARPGGRGAKPPAPAGRGGRGGAKSGGAKSGGAKSGGGKGAKASGAPRGASRSSGVGGAAGVARISGGRGPARSGAPSAAREYRSTQNRGLGGTQVEGRQAVRELLLAGRRDTREIWMANDLDPAPVLDDIIELAGELRVPIREVSRGKLEAEARTDAPQGILAHAAEIPDVDLEDLVQPSENGAPPFLLALDGVTDPGNLGAVLRSAECAGVSGVLMPRHRSAHITPSVTKAAAGAIEYLPMALVGGLPAALTRLKDMGVWSVGLDGGGDHNLWDLDVATGPVVLVLGAEGTGLARLTRQRCDQVVAIPLAGRLGSLNVATAGALACFEVVRRRRG